MCLKCLADEDLGFAEVLKDLGAPGASAVAGAGSSAAKKNGIMEVLNAEVARKKTTSQEYTAVYTAVEAAFWASRARCIRLGRHAGWRAS